MNDFLLSYRLADLLTQKPLRLTYLASLVREPQQKVIIKLFDKECAGQNQQESSLRAHALTALRHAHIVPILDVAINEQGKPYVVSEHRPDGSLRQRLSTLPSGQMQWREAINITMQIGEALSYSHAQQVTHGNIKPENIFFNEVGAVQLTDFSLAPFVDITKLDYTSDLPTIRYMAPEQFKGKVDPYSDQYALACLAYELISGHTPFDASNYAALQAKHTTEFAPSLSAYVLGLPLPIDLAILKALAKKPEERFPDINAFIASLNSRLTSQISGLFLSVLSSSHSNDDASFPTITNDPFFSTLAHRTFLSEPDENRLDGQKHDALRSYPHITQHSSNANPISFADLAKAITINKDNTPPPAKSATPSWQTTPSDIEPVIKEKEKKPSSQEWERYPHLDLQDQAAAKSASDGTPASIDPPLPALSDATQLMHEQKTEEVLLSDTHSMADVSSASKRHHIRRNYAVWISILIAATILTSVLIPYFSHSPSNTSPPNAARRSGNTPAVQNDGQGTNVASVQTTTATVTTTQNKSPKTGVLPTTLPTTRTSSGTPQVVPQATNPVVAPGITPTQTVPTATAIPTPQGTGSVRIDAGGAGGGSFVADEEFTNTSLSGPSYASSAYQTINTSGVSNPAPESVYASARYGSFRYTIPNLTPHAKYKVRLHFAEIYWTQAGQRIFNVLLNSQQVLSNFDIIAAAGATNTAVVEEFVTSADSDGTITIDFTTVKDNPLVNGIEVLAL